MTANTLIGAGAWRAILWSGLVAGALDITAAGILSANPLRMLQSIASGLLGPDAYAGGTATSALGLALHFAIMFVICAVFHVASRKLPFMTQRWILTGVLYGMVVHLFMKFVVLPLSAFPHPITYSVAGFATSFAVHITCVGLPIAFIVRRFSK